MHSLTSYEYVGSKGFIYATFLRCGGLPLPIEESYEKKRKKITEKYSSPWNGSNAGILIRLQMTMVAALCEKTLDEDKIQQLKTQYEDQLAAMKKDFDSLNAKYNVEL